MKRITPLLVVLVLAAGLSGAIFTSVAGDQSDTVTCWKCRKEFEPDRVARKGNCPHCGAKYMLPPATPLPTPTPPPRAAGAAEEPVVEEAPAANTVPMQDAERYMDQTVTIRGRIVGTHLSSRSGNLYLNYHQDFKRYVSIKIPSASLSRFPSGAENYYRGKEVQATGRIVREGQYLRQEVTNPEDLVVF